MALATLDVGFGYYVVHKPYPIFDRNSQPNLSHAVVAYVVSTSDWLALYYDDPTAQPL